MKRFLILILILSFMGSMTLAASDKSNTDNNLNDNVDSTIKVYISDIFEKTGSIESEDHEDLKDDDERFYEADLVKETDIFAEGFTNESTRIVQLPVTIAEMKKHVCGDDNKIKDLFKKAISKYFNLSAEQIRDVKVELKSETQVEIKFVDEPSFQMTDDQFQDGAIGSLKNNFFGPLWKHDLELPFKISEIEKVAGKKKVDEIIKKAILTAINKIASDKDAVKENDFTVKLEKIESGKKTKVEMDFVKTPSPKVKAHGFYDNFIQSLKETSLKSLWIKDAHVVPKINKPKEDEPQGLGAGAITAIVIGCIVGCMLLAGIPYFVYKKKYGAAKLTADIDACDEEEAVADQNSEELFESVHFSMNPEDLRTYSHGDDLMTERTSMFNLPNVKNPAMV